MLALDNLAAPTLDNLVSWICPSQSSPLFLCQSLKYLSPYAYTYPYPYSHPIVYPYAYAYPYPYARV